MSVVALLPPALLAQGFTSGSNGSDGVLAFAENAGTVLFDPSAFDPPLDRDGDNVYHFTTVTVPAGTTVKLSSAVLGEGTPVVWLATGAVEIRGVLDLNGERGRASNDAVVPAVAGAGGFNGGVGGRPGSPATAGSGPGGGAAESGKNGGWAGHLRQGDAAGDRAAAGAAYGNVFLLPLRGGSGGGGGSAPSGSGGGAGGGAILLASSESITVSGRIDAKAGGFGAVGGQALTGGPGSSGAIRLVAPVVRGSGRLDVSFFDAVPGRIRIEAFRNEFTGSLVPAESARAASPGSVFPPPSSPSVRVTRVAGTKLPETPRASFEEPDVTIETTEGVVLEIEARGIPAGTRVRLTLIPESGGSMTVTSEPLAGTLESSTATAGPIVFPAGFTRVSVLATW